MPKNELNAEQWQAIAEKLAEYLDIACDAYPTIHDCAINCPIPCKRNMDWIAQAKKELGYE